MLSYQHGFHAGGFADVLKHAVLALLLEYMTQKEKPLFYFETHAGRGLYDLHSALANKTAEFKSGISLLWPKRAHAADALQPYMKVCEQLNPNGELRYYPGSPLFALKLLRDIDRMYCCELHPKEFDLLSDLSKKTKKVHFEHVDGMRQLQALVPPPERRGLIFIDPSYEVKSEYQTVPEAVLKAYQRFKTGVYCIWYPVIEDRYKRLMSRLKAIEAPALNIEWSLLDKDVVGMQRCGLWVINPPYLLESQIHALRKDLPFKIEISRLDSL